MLAPRVLVTGANGLVGQALVRRLSTRPGADVLATGRRDRPAAVWNGGYVPLDLLDADAIERTLVDFAPTTVVHAAGTAQVEACEADREACWALNVDATSTLAAACARHGSRLVLLSTDFVFDGAAGPYDETARPTPTGTYGRTKLAAENALRTSRVSEWAVVRTTMVFGAPADPTRSDFVRWVVGQLESGASPRVPSDQWRTPTYDETLADGVERVVRFRKSGIFHIAGREWLSTYDFARHIAHRFDLSADAIRPTTTAELHPGAPRPLRAGLLITRAEAELGFRPLSLDAALGRLRQRLAAGSARPS